MNSMVARALRCHNSRQSPTTNGKAFYRCGMKTNRKQKPLNQMASGYFHKKMKQQRMKCDFLTYDCETYEIYNYYYENTELEWHITHCAL